MRTTLNKFAATSLLCFLAISPLHAQNSPETTLPLVESNTNGVRKYPEALAKQEMEADKDLEKTRMDNEKDLEKTRLDNEKAMANSKSDNHRLIVHDLAWNSWVIFVIAIFFFGYLKDKRRHETIRLMIEKGTPITPELLAALRKNRSRVRSNHDPHGYLCWGTTLTAVGIALVVFPVWGKAGWIVLAIGVANLILWIIDKSFGNDGQAN